VADAGLLDPQQICLICCCVCLLNDKSFWWHIYSSSQSIGVHQHYTHRTAGVM